jgi:cyclophilin family peptidyl-prolyl cis-trans isomerase
MKRLGLRKRSAKARHQQFQRARILEWLEDRAMLATIAAGNEFLVNTAIYGGQQLAASAPSVAVNGAGDFLVTYDGFGAGDRDGVFVRRYDANGAALGESILANITIAGHQHDATSALGANGDFVVVWSGRGPGDSNGIFARRFSASGNSGEIAVNATTGGDQHSAAIAMAADGSFVVTWAGNGTGDSQGVFARRFAASGTPLSAEIRVNSSTLLKQQTPAISMADDGSFVITWTSQLQDGSGFGVFAQRFNNQAVAQGGEFRVNTTTAGDQTDPQIAVAGDGRFVIAWTGLDQSGSGIFAKQFNAAGTAVGSEFLVNTTTTGNQLDPHLAIDQRGDFAISWTSVGQDGSGFGIVGQNFADDGTRDGGEYIANSLVIGHQQNASVGADDFGNLVFVWSGTGPGDGRGVLARRFVPDRDLRPPVITASLANDTGLSNSDHITRDPTVNANVSDQSFITRLQASLRSPTTTFTAPPLVDIPIPANFRGPIVLDRARLEQIAGGTLADGNYRLLLQATDEEGNVSSLFELNFTLDTIAPDAPTMLDLPASEDTGISNTDNLINKVRPAIEIAAPSGNLVQLFVDGQFVAQGLAAAGGIASVASGFDIGNGVHVYTARVIDVAGNESPTSTASLTVTTDTTPPDGPTAVDLVSTSDSGISQTDNLTNDNTPTIQVATTIGARVRLLVDGVSRAEGVATGATIDLTPTAAVGDGNHQFTAVVVDDAGNVSTAAAPLTITIDTSGPDAPILDLTDASDTGNVIGDNVTRDTTPTIRVNTQTGNTVRLSRDGGTLVGESSTGTVNFADFTTPALSEGTHTFSAVATDAAGNVGTPASASALQIVIDSIRIDLASASDTGAGNADNLTSQNQPTLEVTAPPMSTVSITIDGTAAGSMTADANGIATFTTPPLTNGVHIVRATAVDTAGINRIGRGALALTIDAAAPTVANPIADVTVQQNAADTTISLDDRFADVDGLGTVVRFTTSAGVFDVELYDNIASTPQADHVANFLNYLSDYTNSIFHRVIPGFVAQGGQIHTDGSLIQTDPPVTNEFLLSNSVGTIALARTSVVNSGTSQFFFSLVDNSDNLNNQNEGFTAFGQVLGSGLSVLTGLPSTSVVPGGSTTGAPVVNSVAVLPAGDRLLTYSILVNSNASLVTASIVNNNVVLDYQPGETGTASITVRATDLAGNVVDDTFLVTVNPGGALMSAAASGAAPLDPATLASLPSTELPPQMASVMAEAVRRWTNAGLDPASVQFLQNVSFKLADLPTGYLGFALADTIWLDSNADGQGWFIDPTAGDDLEFAADVAGQLHAAGDASAGVDLLSVAAHELGHVLGLSHDTSQDGQLMADTLNVGVRQLPSAALVDALLAAEL